MEIEVLGRTITRPVLIVNGLEHTQLVIGYDTIKEEGMVIDGKKDSVAWSDIPREENWAVAALCAIRSTEIEPKTVAKIVVQPKMGAKTLRGGVLGVCASAHGSPLLLWDSLVSTDDQGRVTLAVANHQIHAVKIKPGTCVGFMHNETFEEAETKERTDEFIHSFFGDFGKEPPEPKTGEVERLREPEREYLLSKMHIKAPGRWRQQYIDLLLRYHDTLSKSKFDLGWSDVVRHKIRMKSEEPIFVRQFRVPMHHQEVLREFVNELLRKGAIRPSRSPYNSPIFCVDKKMPHDAKPGDKPPLRAVLDFRTINLNSMPDRYSMRDVRECLDEVGLEESDTYSAVDLTSGFWQQSLEEESRQYTAFTAPGTSGGTKYEFCVTPMGLAGSPSSFARMILYILRGLSNLICYVDDVLAHNKGHEEHLKTLEELMLRFRKYGLKINVEKSIFGASEVQYLGYTLENGRISPSKDKAEAVRNFPEPRSAKSIREFVGLTNYFRNLVENYSRKAAPLIRLTTGAAKWDGGEMDNEAKDAFETLKKDLTTEPVVTLPKKDRPFVVYTDAALGDKNNPGGLGAMLVQIDKSGTEHTIAFASRSLKQHEKNYSAFLLEKAGVVWAIDYWSYYLIGQRFIVKTDHRPLEALSSVHKKTLDRLAEQMLEYDFQIEYKEGKLNVVADALSRNAVICSLWAADEDEHSIEVAQREDEETSMLRNFLLNKTLPEDEEKRSWVKRNVKNCSMEAGLVWHTTAREGFRNKKLLFAPRVMRAQIMSDAHTRVEAGHGGGHRTSERCRLSFWWPSMDRDCAVMVKNCEVCQLARAKKEPPAKLQPLPRARFPNDRCHIDLFGQLRGSEGNLKYIMVMTDAYTKWAEVAVIEDKTAETIARVLTERWLVRFACMNVLVSDQGKEFCNAIVNEVCKLFGIEKRRTSPFHPETNAQAEVFNKSIINYMRSMLNNNTTLEWEAMLPMMQLAYNAHCHRSTRESPFFLTYGRDPRLPYLSLAQKMPTYSESFAGNQFRALSEAHRRATENMAEAEKIRVDYFNRMAKERNFAPGERVMVYFPNVKPGVNQKFVKRWRIYQVVKTVGPVNLRLRPIANSGQEKNILVHVNRVRHANQEEIRTENDTKTKEVAGSKKGSSADKAIKTNEVGEPGNGGYEGPEENQQPRYYGGGRVADDRRHEGEDGQEEEEEPQAEEHGGSELDEADSSESQRTRQQSQQQEQSESENARGPSQMQSQQIPEDRISRFQEQEQDLVQSGSAQGALQEQESRPAAASTAETAGNRGPESGPRQCQRTTTSCATNSLRKPKRGEDPYPSDDLNQGRNPPSGTRMARAESPDSFFKQQERENAVQEIMDSSPPQNPEEKSSENPSHRPNPPTLNPSSTTLKRPTEPKMVRWEDNMTTEETSLHTKQQERIHQRTMTGEEKIPLAQGRGTGSTTGRSRQETKKEERTDKKGTAAPLPPSILKTSNTKSSSKSTAPSTDRQAASHAATSSSEGPSSSTGRPPSPARRSRRLQGTEPPEMKLPSKPLEYMTLEEARRELRRVQEEAPRPRRK